ncbi:DUF3858 domain-containing protein [Xanthomarina sp. GH4-25]|uniref:transglutaminase domain-containing protein n=1 Tax=Xanthomarina sp. GH4-25 TaxID=3349335 RepID=UPI0038780424
MKYILLFACVFTFQIAIAQDYKFGKVSKEELKETQHPLEPNANAAVLYRSQDVKFTYVQDLGFVQQNYVSERIKIYNKEGFEYATKRIRLYDGDKNTEDVLKSLKAYTYTLENNKIVETKLGKNEIFEEKINKYWKATQFAMPNIKEGCVIEYKYMIESELLAIDEIPFQTTIPINKLDLRVGTPEYYKYSTIVNPKATYYPQLKQFNEQAKITLSKTRQSNARSVGSATSLDYSTIDYFINVITSNLVNIPSLEDEAYVDNLSNYQAKLIMELKSIQFPNEPFENLSTSWEEVTKTIYDSNDFGQQLKRSGYFGNDLDTAIAGATEPIEQVYHIFNFVKSKVKWNGTYGYYTELGVKQAYKQGVGNVGDINLILIAMLRETGLDANPVLISTKDNGIPLFPTRRGFNYVICAVNTEQGQVLLDATESFTSLNVLPVKILNWQGRLIRKDGSSDWVSLSASQASKEIVSLNVKLDSDLSATGKIRNQYTDYKALEYRNTYENYSEDDLIKAIESKNGNLLVSNIEVEDMNVPVKPVLLSYEYQLDEALEEIGDNYYFSPLLFLKIKESPFKLQTRKYPIDLNFPTSRKYMVNIMLPEGFQVESLPENVKLEYNSNEGEFTYLIRENGSMLQLVITLNLNNTLILPTNYEQFKQFFELVVNKQAEKIVLKKV